MSSFEASASCTLLMMASSAFRCSVSFSSRCVSSKSRAFSSATPMLEATVESRRTSASPKASSRSKLSRMMEPRKRSPDEHRHEHRGLAPVGARDDLHAEGIRRGPVVHDDRLALEQLRMHGPIAVFRKRDPLLLDAMLVRIERTNEAGLLLTPEDAHVPRPEYLAQLVAHQVDDRLEVQLGAHSLLDAVDHRQLRVSLLRLLQQALRLVEEPRVLERDAHARRHRREQTHLGFVKSVLAFVAPEPDLPHDTVRPDDGGVDGRQARLGARQGRKSQCCRIALIAQHERHSPCFEERVDATRLQGRGRVLQPNARARTRRGSGRFGSSGRTQRMPMSPVLEHLTQLVAHQVDDRLEVQLRRHAQLDAVDHREFRGPLFRLLEQSLRFVEQAGVLEGDAQAAGERD